MRVLPSGSAALLCEVDDLEQVLGLHAALTDGRPDGVLDVVPAARTVLVTLDPLRCSLIEAERWVRGVEVRSGARQEGAVVEVPVTYDGPDLEDVAELLHCSAAEVVRRHTSAEWDVAFCGFAPGFGYLRAAGEDTWDVPRRSSPRTRVPAGSVALAGEFSGVYPRESPGGWQLVGSTDLVTFDLAREPAALLRPGVRVRFVERDAR